MPSFKALTIVLLSLLCVFMLGQGCPPATSPDGNGDSGDNGDNGDNGDSDGDSMTGNSGITGKYAGSSVCVTCHIQIQHNWEETLHAEALATLEGIGQGSNPDCLPCHTVGYGESGGFVDRATTNDLADVGCETCHGPSRDHVQNVADSSLLPPVDISSEVCATCHTGSHHPHFEEWESSGHALVTEAAADDFAQPVLLSVCGECHSGDYFYRSVLLGEDVPDDLLAGLPREQMNAVECVICHDPHAQTNNAPEPEDGRDFQLRYPEVASPPPVNTVAAATDKTRFNLCGQCHLSRGRTWEATTRGPHHSVQGNIYAGEMPVPDGTSPLVLSRVSVHSFATEQCATCHLFRQDFQSEIAPAISGHTFAVNEASCSSPSCHPSQMQALAAQQTLETEIQTRLDDIASRLGDPSTWEYSAEGGPDADGQAALSDEIKQVRFLYHYVVSDASLGIHNPDYVRDIVEKAEEILTSIGL